MTKKAPHKKPSSYKTTSYKTPSYNRPYQVAPDLEGGDEEYYYTTKQLSGLLSLATSTLSGYRRSGVGPKYISIGYRTCRYARSDVQAYMKERERQSTSEY